MNKFKSFFQMLNLKKYIMSKKIKKEKIDNIDDGEPDTQVLKDVKSSKLNFFQIFSIILGFIAVFTCFFWYICLPTGVVGCIFAFVGNKRNNIVKADSKVMINVVGILLCLAIIAIEIIFSSFSTKYMTNDYTLNYGVTWNTDESRSKLKLLYKDNENMYFMYDKSYNLSEDFNMLKKSDRESLYSTYYNKYVENAKNDYYVLSDAKGFFRVSIFSNTYVAYIPYISYSSGYGRFYFVTSR